MLIKELLLLEKKNEKDLTVQVKSFSDKFFTMLFKKIAKDFSHVSYIKSGFSSGKLPKLDYDDDNYPFTQSKIIFPVGNAKFRLETNGKNLMVDVVWDDKQNKVDFEESEKFKMVFENGDKINIDVKYVCDQFYSQIFQDLLDGYGDSIETMTYNNIKKKK